MCKIIISEIIVLNAAIIYVYLVCGNHTHTARARTRERSAAAAAHRAGKSTQFNIFRKIYI